MECCFLLPVSVMPVCCLVVTRPLERRMLWQAISTISTVGLNSSREDKVANSLTSIDVKPIALMGLQLLVFVLSFYLIVVPPVEKDPHH